MHVMVEEHNSMTQTTGCPGSTGGTVKTEIYQTEGEEQKILNINLD